MNLTQESQNSFLQHHADLSIDPSKQVCPRFDEKSIALFDVGDLNKIGVPVVDNCAEEHIQ